MSSRIIDQKSFKTEFSLHFPTFTNFNDSLDTFFNNLSLNFRKQPIKFAKCSTKQYIARATSVIELPTPHAIFMQVKPHIHSDANFSTKHIRFRRIETSRTIYRTSVSYTFRYIVIQQKRGRISPIKSLEICLIINDPLRGRG